MVSIKHLLLLASTAAATILGRRDATTVYNDITGIDTAVHNLTAVVSAYNGGITQSAPILTASVAIHAINRQGFNDASASGPFSSADSKAIVDHVNNSVGVSIPASIKALESKKALLDAAQITSIVEAFVELLKYDHDSFSLVVGTKLSPDQVAGGVLAAGAIDAALDGAVLFFAA